MRGNGKWWTFVAVAVVAATADWLSKEIVFARVRATPEERIEVWPERFELLARYNTAGVWSIGFGQAHSNTVLAAISAAAVVLMVGWGWRAAPREGWWFAVTLGAIAGGAVGNLLDRVRFGGVRDFIQVYLLNGYAYPVFNVADCCLVLGALAMFVFLWKAPAPAGAPASGVP